MRSMNQFSPCMLLLLLGTQTVRSFSTRLSTRTNSLAFVVVPRQLAESRTTTRQCLLWSLLSSKSDGDDDWYSDYNPQAHQYKERDFDSSNEGYSGGGGGQRYGQDRYGGGRSSGRSSSSSSSGRGGSGRFGAQGGGGSGYERDESADDSNVDVGAVERLIGERTAARKGGDYDAADQIRDQLLNNYGVQVWDKERIWRTGCSASGSGARRPGIGGGGRFGGDRSGGRGRDGGGRQQRPPKDFGPKGHDYERSPDAGPITASITEDEINELIAARLQCKMSRRFDEADRIQGELTSNGVYIHDARKEWRADGVMFGDYANGDRPGKERGSRSSDRNKPFDQSPYSTGIDSLTDDQVATIDALVSRRAGAKLSRNYKTADNIRDELKDDYNVFIDDRLRQWSVGGDFGPEAPGNHDRPWIMSLNSAPVADEEQEAIIISELEKRNEAKAARDFDTADSIRELLSTNFNVAIDDRLRQWSVGGDFGLPTKTKRDGRFVRRGGGDLSEEEVAEISDLVEERARAKKNRDFETADELRDTLEARFFVKVDDKSREWRVMSDDYVMTRSNHLSDKLDDEAIYYIQDRIKERSELKKSRNYNAADEIRDELRSKYSVSIDDRTREWVVDVDQYTVVERSRAPRSYAYVEDGDDAGIEDKFENSDGSQEGSNLAELTIPALKEKLKAAGLPVSGRKAELIERLTSDAD